MRLVIVLILEIEQMAPNSNQSFTFLVIVTKFVSNLKMGFHCRAGTKGYIEHDIFAFTRIFVAAHNVST